MKRKCFPSHDYECIKTYHNRDFSKTEVLECVNCHCRTTRVVDKIAPFEGVFDNMSDYRRAEESRILRSLPSCMSK
jgi:cytochrome c